MMDEVSIQEREFRKKKEQEITEKGLEGFLAVNPATKLAMTWAPVKLSR